MKKLISVFLSVIFLITVFSQNLFAASFTDTDDYNTEIEFLAESNVIVGKSEGIYAPNDLLNRAEMIKILLESIGISPDEDSYKDCFPDVDGWYERYVCYGYGEGIISGHPDGTFKPGDNVNLAEALTMASNTFGIEFEADETDTQWYSTFVEGSENYGIADQGYGPGDYISREVMAEIVVRVAVVSITQNVYNPLALRQVRSWDKYIQDFSDDISIATLQENLTSVGGDEWIVKITSSNGDRFEILFSHKNEPFVSEEGVEELSLPPTIEIEEGTGIAEIGINSDFYFDGIVSPVEKSALVDADLYGYFDTSLNLEYFPDQKIVYINSDLKEKSGIFNLDTGVVTGDIEITRGVTNLNDYFDENGGVPFTVCVSDGGDYMGEVGIFDDFETVGVRDCPYYKPSEPEEEPVVIKPLPFASRWNENALIGLPFSKTPPSSTDIVIGGGAQDGGDLIGQYPWDDYVFEADPFENDEIDSDDGDISNDDSDDDQPSVSGIPDGFPEPTKNPGEGYDEPTESSKEWDKWREYSDEVDEKNSKINKDNGEMLEEGQKTLEEWIAGRGLALPDPPPVFDASTCCPNYSEIKSCCSDLNLDIKEGREEYDKRIQCLVDEFERLNLKLYLLMQNVNYWINRIASLEKAEAAFGQLELFTDLQKKLGHVAIDVATGGGGWLDGVVSGLIGEFFGDDYADAFNIGCDPDNANSTVKDRVKGELEKAVADITGFKDKVREVANGVADKLEMGDTEKEGFVNDIVDRFGESPTNLANPAEWLKAVYDAILNSVGSAATGFINSVEKIRQKLEEDLIEAWETVELMKQINALLMSIRENCGSKYRVGLKKRTEELEEIEKKYVEGITEDGNSLLGSLKWILDNEFWDLAGDDPGPEALKERLLERLKELLCKLGFDLCWVDIEFDVEYKSDPNIGSFSWKITNFTISKRTTKKPGCECEEEDDDTDDIGYSDDIDDTDDDADDDGWVDDIDDWVDDTDDDDIDYDDTDDYCDYCDYCDSLDVETFVYEIMGDVYYDQETQYVLTMDCDLMIPESYILDRFGEVYGVEKNYLIWDFFTSIENEGIWFNFWDGYFHDEYGYVSVPF